MSLTPRLVCSVTPDAAGGELPDGTTALVDILRELAAILPGLKAAIKRKPTVERLALRINDAAAAIGVSRRVIERERTAGRFPKPDLQIGKAPLWRIETIRNYLDSAKGGNR